jgi:serine/threonine-protein kinase
MLGGYRLTALLGAGGMAEVYQGSDPGSGRDVAVKVLPRALAQDPGYVNRFRDEARRVAALKHPNVVPLLRYGEEGGLLYIVMPVLAESLRDRMERDRVIAPTEAAKLAVQVAAALDAAHKQGLVHRDVKPENVLINGQGRALLTDFGISREVDVLSKASAQRTLAATGLPVGTPEYMAPEQLRGGAFDQRVDVYALGAVLYEMLTGHVPHDANTPYEVAALVLTEPTRPPSQHNPAIWPALDRVVMRALAPDAADRYPDMLSFATALRHAVVGEGSRLARRRRERALFTGNLRWPAALRAGPAVAAGAVGAVAAAFGGIRGAAANGSGGGFASFTEDRRRLLLVGLATLLVVGLVGGGSFAAVRHFLAPGSGPLLGSIAGRGTEAVSTITEHATPTLSAAAIAATQTATAPTATPLPPTATPVPVPITLNTNAPQTTTGHDNNTGQDFCTGSVILTNTTGGSVKWTLSDPSHRFDWLYWVDGNPLFGSVSGTITAGKQSELDIRHYANACTSQRSNIQPFSVTVNGTAVASFTFKY